MLKKLKSLRVAILCAFLGGLFLVTPSAQIVLNSLPYINSAGTAIGSVIIPTASSFGFVGVGNALKLSGTGTCIAASDGGCYIIEGASQVLINSAGLFLASAGASYTNIKLPSATAGLINLENAAGTSGVGFDVTTDGTLKVRNRSQTAGTGALDLGGKVTAYNGVTTTGWGVPSIVASGRSTAQTGAVASVATYTVGAADGSFEVSCEVLVTVATTHSFGCSVGFTDEGNTARTYFLNFTTSAGQANGAAAIVNGNGTITYGGNPLHIRAKAATAITIGTSGTFTTVTYNVEGSIRQIS